jgi:alpha-tubulin suppressor-like RCC1 family protein
MRKVALRRRLGFSVVLALAVAAFGCRDGAEPTAPSRLVPALHPASVAALAFRQVSVGESKSCGVTRAGEVYCWGENELRPVRVPGGHVFRQVSARGRFHTCGVTTTDVAWCWGTNGLGQLGSGTEDDSPQPVRVAGGLAFREVTVGRLHSCGVTTGNIAYCWGHNQAGELGIGTINGVLQPVRVARRLAFRQLSAGEQLTCGVTTDDAAWCWGENTSGQLGIGALEAPESCFTGDNSVPCSTRPIRVKRGLRFDHVSVGTAHVCGVTTDHLAYCWGANAAGNLGQKPDFRPELCPDGGACSTRPIRVAGRLAFVEVDAGGAHTCGVTTGGIAYCWGANSIGQLGIGGKVSLADCFGVPCAIRPRQVSGGLAFRSVRAGLDHTCGVTTGDVAFCWGANFSGQVGDGTTQRRLRPRRVEAGS